MHIAPESQTTDVTVCPAALVVAEPRCDDSLERCVDRGRIRLKFTVPIGPTGGPIGLALARHQDLTLRADGDLQPEEVIQLMQFGARTLSVLPLVAAGQLIGCLYYDQLELVAAPTSVIESALRRLRDRTLQVLSRKR